MKFKFQEMPNKLARLGYFCTKIYRKPCWGLNKNDEGLL